MIRKAIPFLIVLAVFFGGVELGMASNFPTCEGSPSQVSLFSKHKTKNWDSCIGDSTYKGIFINGKTWHERYIGLFENGGLDGYGYRQFWNYSTDVGYTEEGIFQNGRLIDKKKHHKY